MTTKPDKSRRLNVQQRNAIELLIVGKSDREVAEVVNVTRQTVSGWRLHDPFFQAELNRQRSELFGAAIDRLRNLVPKALDVIEHELEGPNAYRAAFEVLKLAGFDRTGRNISGTSILSIGPTLAEDIIDAEVRNTRSMEANAILLEMTGAGPVSDLERAEALSQIEARRKEFEEG